MKDPIYWPFRLRM